MSTFDAVLQLGVFALILGWFLVVRLIRVTPREAHRLVKNGALLLDVSRPDEFDNGRPPGALRVPVEILREKPLPGLARNRPIVVCCRTGARSGRAAHLLRRAGFVAVNDLGRWSRW